MNPGELTKQIAIQTPSTTSENSCGEGMSGYTTVATPWAKVEPKAEGKYQITIRYRKGVEKGMRVQLQEAKLLEIKDVINPKMKNIQLILMCEEVKPCQNSG